MVLALLGREKEAIAYLREQEGKLPHFSIRQYSVALRTMLEGDREPCLAAIAHVLAGDLPDPEGLYWMARYLARLEDHRAAGVLDAAIDGGFNAWSFMAWDPWLESLRGTPAFEATKARAETHYRAASAAFVEAGGAQLLGGPAVVF